MLQHCGFKALLLTVGMDKHVVAAAVQSNPRRAAAAVLGALTTAVAHFDLNQKSVTAASVLVITTFATQTGHRHSSSLDALGMLQQLGRIPGLGACLTACVAYHMHHSVMQQGRPQIANETGLTSISSCLRLLWRTAGYAPAGQPQHVTQQQLESMQLLRLAAQLPMHGRQPSESVSRATLHAEVLHILLYSPALHSDYQLLLRFWRDVGVHQLQVCVPRLGYCRCCC